MIKFKELRGEIAKQKKMRKMTNVDLAEMVGAKVSRIEAFMYGSREPEDLAHKLADALGIDMNGLQ